MVRAAKAQSRAVDLLPLIEEIRSTGATTLQAIADDLNAKGVPTARGSTWAPVQVKRIIARSIRACATMPQILPDMIKILAETL